VNRTGPSSIRCESSSTPVIEQLDHDHTRTTRLGSLSAAIALVAACPPNAPYNPPWNSNWKPDGTDHNYLISSAFNNSLENNSINHGMDQVNRSVLNASTSATWIDVRVIQAALTGSAGDYRCVENHSNGTCHLSTIRIDTDIGTAGATEAYWKAVVCHEMGHSSGIGERASNAPSCIACPATSAYKSFDSNEVTVINSHFPS